jgi:uncharacterized protein YndB with AHSA1/START domain
MTKHDEVLFPDDAPTITIVRWLNAPRALVWDAWTDPAQIVAWWGPPDFATPRVELEVRPGGRWRIDMQAPDGTVYPNKGRYLEVVPPEKLVWTDEVDADEAAWGEDAPPSTVNTTTFEEIGGKTRLTVTTRLDNIALRDRLRDMGWATGFGESLDRLTALLARS